MSVRAHVGIAILVVTIQPLLWSAASAQADRPDGHRWVLGGMAEVWGGNGEALFAAGFKAGWYRPATVGVEFGLSALPQYLSGGGLVVVPEAGLTVQELAGGALLLARLGVSPVVGIGSGGVGGIFLGYFGVGALVPAGPVGLRFDASRRFFGSGGGGVWSFGVGVTTPLRFRPRG